MNIALMAHDNRKALMLQFCTAYCGILAKHTLCATARTGQQIADATGLTIHRFLSFDHGGGQQIAARIAYNEIDMVLCFSDPNRKTTDEDIAYISRLCDQNNVPFASNLATAEMLVLGLDRGDLDWRDIVNHKSKPCTARRTRQRRTAAPICRAGPMCPAAPMRYPFGRTESSAPTTGRRGRRPLQAASPTREFCQRAGLTRGGKSHTIRSNRADLAGVACTPPLQERRATG